MAPDYRAFRASLAVQGPRCSRSCLSNTGGFAGSARGQGLPQGLSPMLRSLTWPRVAARRERTIPHWPSEVQRGPTTGLGGQTLPEGDPLGGGPSGDASYTLPSGRPPQSPQGAPANGDQRGPWSLRQLGLLLQAWRLQRTRVCTLAQVRGAARLPTDTRSTPLGTTNSPRARGRPPTRSRASPCASTPAHAGPVRP